MPLCSLHSNMITLNMCNLCKSTKTFCKFRWSLIFDSIKRRIHVKRDTASGGQEECIRISVLGCGMQLYTLRQQEAILQLKFEMPRMSKKKKT